MLYDSKLTRQGQTTIPKTLREKFGMDEGDDVTFIDLGDYIAILPKPSNALETLKQLEVDDLASVPEIKKTALETAQREVEEKSKDQ